MSSQVEETVEVTWGLSATGIFDVTGKSIRKWSKSGFLVQFPLGFLIDLLDCAVTDLRIGRHLAVDSAGVAQW